MRILVTGGAGFIGSHLADALLSMGHEVRVLDSLEPQVHGAWGRPPAYLSQDVEFILGDVRDSDAVRRALVGVEVVYHQAAAVGVAQSMYEIRHYVAGNSLGTAVLLETIANERAGVNLVVVASSMSIYGEGEYVCATCGPVPAEVREGSQLARAEWEQTCMHCRGTLEPRPTREGKPLRPQSPYAISKRCQEELCLAIGRAYRIPTIALRYFNVYGPRQALSNPYAGLAAIFSGRLLNGDPPLLFEDGMQSRDFIHVSDVVRANLLALDAPQAQYRAINIGTGCRTTVRQFACGLAEALGSDLRPVVTCRYRAGDIRHCYADIAQARAVLGFEPEVTLEEGLTTLASWVHGQLSADRIKEAMMELKARGLMS